MRTHEFWRYNQLEKRSLDLHHWCADQKISTKLDFAEGFAVANCDHRKFTKAQFQSHDLPNDS